mmetsp:Transcript_54802/g.163132  ORF Transcript_54802/g.163132 Transcript_54802/m.163132 type:complete len:286 (-) Transcript_54802:67-924(-)
MFRGEVVDPTRGPRIAHSVPPAGDEVVHRHDQQEGLEDVDDGGEAGIRRVSFQVVHKRSDLHQAYEPQDPRNAHQAERLAQPRVAHRCGHALLPNDQGPIQGNNDDIRHKLPSEVMFRDEPRSHLHDAGPVETAEKRDTDVHSPETCRHEGHDQLEARRPLPEYHQRSVHNVEHEEKHANGVPEQALLGPGRQDTPGHDGGCIRRVPEHLAELLGRAQAALDASQRNLCHASTFRPNNHLVRRIRPSAEDLQRRPLPGRLTVQSCRRHRWGGRQLKGLVLALHQP